MVQMSRRRALQLLAGTAAVVSPIPAAEALQAQAAVAVSPGEHSGRPVDGLLQEFDYSAVTVDDTIAQAQRANVTSLLMGLPEDNLLKPFRAMAGKPAPGMSLGGWYAWNPDYDYHHNAPGFAPAHCFGQWCSALTRLSASGSGEAPMQKALHLRVQMAEAITPDYFAKTRFPAYSYDKLVCGLMDAHRLGNDPQAFATLDKVTQAAQPSLPGRAIERETQYRMGKDLSWMWDESYTMPENLYLAAAMGAGDRYRAMADAYLADDFFFQPLSRGEDKMCDRHAYSYVNALCSAMMAYMVRGDAMHLKAAKNGFAQLQAQSFATGGWGPDEELRKQGYDQLKGTLTDTHHGFETPCGSYAHAKLTRYLLRVTRDGSYGDSMERVLWNTTRGSLPIEPDGNAFYYADYNVEGSRAYYHDHWPCCSGTLPQIVADYGINTYLHAPGELWVNLYGPSTLEWKSQGVRVVQSGDFPHESMIRLSVTPMHPVEFTMYLRIPAWTGGAAKLVVNGQPQTLRVSQGFAAVHRVWHPGDVVQLELPMSLRLEPLPSNGGPEHPGTVALLYGPRVLFLLREPGDTGAITATADALLKAQQVSPHEWHVTTRSGERSMTPFTEVGSRSYSTYLELA